MVSLTYESRLLINSHKFCDQTSLVNEMAVFSQKWFFGCTVNNLFLFWNLFPSKVPSNLREYLLINSNKYCDQTSLANEMVVFGQKQIKFLLDEIQPNWSEK